MTGEELEVRKRLSVTVALVEIASVALLVFFLERRVVADTTGILLLAFFPIAFGLHLTEEFIAPGGFISWDHIYRPRFAGTPGSFYVNVNTYPAILLLLFTAASFNYRGEFGRGVPSWLVFLTMMGWNAVYHLRGAMRTRRYSPGMITGLALFIPLTAASYTHFLSRRVIDWPTAAVCMVIALLAWPVLDLMKKRGGRKTA
jgi:hypothetical protein